MMRSCDTCEFWDSGDAKKGNCRKRSPIRVRHDIGYSEEGTDHLALWPVTRDDDWCGEWQEFA